MLNISVDGVYEVRQAMEGLVSTIVDAANTKTIVEVENAIFNMADSHTKSGMLISSVFKQRIDGKQWRAGHDLQIAPHALFVVFGTKPHEIVPRDKKALRWVGAGNKFVFAKRVNHPGTKADNYMEIIASAAPAIFMRHYDTLFKGT